MSVREFPVDSERAISTLMRLIAVEGTTGHEAAIMAEVAACLKEAGVPASAIKHDDAQKRIPVPTPVGNMIVQLPGTRPGPRRMFSSHVDTVPLCAGAKPVRQATKIVPAGKTALGGDDRTGVAVLVSLVATLLKNKLSYPPLTLLFTVREESGLHGARHVDADMLGDPKFGFNFDGRSASEITIGAVGAQRWECEIFGKAAHAGVAPERGISATAVASLAIADIVRHGWFGRVIHGEHRGTSNVGSLSGPDGGSAGNATNVVTDYVLVKGEARSHDTKFASTIAAAYKAAFRAAATQVCDASGKSAKVKFTNRLDYAPFRLKESSPAIAVARRAVAAIGREPKLKIADGGLDANWFVKHGVPTLTFGAGQNNIHTIEEFVDLSEFVAGCRVAVALATEESA
ncbi:MAG: M20/M25/M40 family metallo-hydrolase [Gemmataceae bacterium]|nr:M20/M25/M40 family metallo-hydrolase [Gemmataceae bacterium]